jgi:hypothetical protein
VEATVPFAVQTEARTQLRTVARVLGVRQLEVKPSPDLICPLVTTATLSSDDLISQSVGYSAVKLPLSIYRGVAASG